MTVPRSPDEPCAGERTARTGGASRENARGQHPPRDPYADCGAAQRAAMDAAEAAELGRTDLRVLLAVFRETATYSRLNVSITPAKFRAWLPGVDPAHVRLSLRRLAACGAIGYRPATRDTPMILALPDPRTVAGVQTPGTRSRDRRADARHGRRPDARVAPAGDLRVEKKIEKVPSADRAVAPVREAVATDGVDGDHSIKVDTAFGELELCLTSDQRDELDAGTTASREDGRRPERAGVDELETVSTVSDDDQADDVGPFGGVVSYRDLIGVELYAAAAARIPAALLDTALGEDTAGVQRVARAAGGDVEAFLVALLRGEHAPGSRLARIVPPSLETGWGADADAAARPQRVELGRLIRLARGDVEQPQGSPTGVGGRNGTLATPSDQAVERNAAAWWASVSGASLYREQPRQLADAWAEHAAGVRHQWAESTTADNPVGAFFKRLERGQHRDPVPLQVLDDKRHRSALQNRRNASVDLAVLRAQAEAARRFGAGESGDDPAMMAALMLYVRWRIEKHADPTDAAERASDQAFQAAPQSVGAAVPPDVLGRVGEEVLAAAATRQPSTSWAA